MFMPIKRSFITDFVDKNETDANLSRGYLLGGLWLYLHAINYTLFE